MLDGVRTANMIVCPHHIRISHVFSEMVDCSGGISGIALARKASREERSKSDKSRAVEVRGLFDKINQEKSPRSRRVRLDSDEERRLASWCVERETGKDILRVKPRSIRKKSEVRGCVEETE